MPSHLFVRCQIASCAQAGLALALFGGHMVRIPANVSSRLIFGPRSRTCRWLSQLTVPWPERYRLGSTGTLMPSIRSFSVLSVLIALG